VICYSTRKDCFVLNVDGSRFGYGKAEVDGLIRRGDGS